MTFLRDYERGEGLVENSTAPRTSRLRRVIAAIALASFAVYSLGIFSPTSASARPSRSRKAMVRAETVRLRSAPGHKGKMTALLDAGRVAKVVKKQDGWVKLKLATGTEGWVRADLLSVNKKATKDRGSFAPAHNDDDDAPRHARRAKREKEAEVAREEKHTKKKVVAKAHPKMKPLATAKAKVAAPKHAAHPQPVRVANRPSTKPSAEQEVIRPTVPVEAVSSPVALTNSTPNGEQPERPLAAVASTRPDVGRDSGSIEAVAPSENINVDRAEVIETKAPVRPTTTKKVKGGVAPAITVPINRASKRGDKIVRRALSYRGVPYRMGATGRGAFDCSGFTRYILNQSGESLPRTAAEQYAHGTPIAKSDLKSGDLVFFKNTYKHGVSHVGIYMGDGKFVHASSRGGVRTSMLSEAYYVHHWAGARRPRIVQGSD